MGDQEGGSFRTPGGEHGSREPHGCGEGGHILDILKADLSEIGGWRSVRGERQRGVLNYSKVLG